MTALAPLDHPRPSASAEPQERTGRRRAAVLGVAVGLGALLFWALAIGDGRTPETGLPGAGRLVEWGLPLSTLAGRVAAVGTVGTLLFAAVLRPGSAGAPPPESRRALRAAAGWALAWTVATTLGGLLTLSRLLGTAPTSLSWASVRVFVEDTGTGRAALLGAALTGVVAVAATRSSRAGAQALLAVALGALLLPVWLSGHSSASDDHLLAVGTLGVHVVAATVWVGGLLALLVHGRREGAAEAAPRFSRLALVCFLATAGSGVLAAVLVLGCTAAAVAALGTGYGALLIAKTAALSLLGVLGWQHRRSTLPRLRAGEHRSFRRFATVEIALMLATVTLAVALAASPPPSAAANGSASPGTAGSTSSTAPPTDPMAGHDHGDLSVGVLVDEERFHVAGPVAAGSRVTVFNGSGEQVTLTAADGSFDVVLPAGALSTFLAPQQPGEHPFRSGHSAAFADVLVVG